MGWLKEPQVGTKHNCLEADHTAPFDFISDVLIGRVLNYLAWANRGGSKSYLAGLIAWALSSFFPRLETTILGGSLDQSEKVYKAMKDIWILTDLENEYLEAEPTRRLSSWRNGSTVAVLTASTRSTRGPHPQHLIMDEVDEMPEEVYRAALSQPQSKHGLAARLGQFSTNHRSGGMMDEALEQARIHRTPIYRWCIWECLEPCRDYSCSTCKLSAWCPGQHMKAADGYYRIQDFIDKLEHLSENALQVEWLCRKIGRDDLVYGDQFDAKIHARNDLPGFDINRAVLISVDWGGTHPFSLGAWQRFNIGWVRIDEIQQPGDNPHLIKAAEEKPWWNHIRGGVGDPSRPDLMGEWRAKGIPMTAADNDVDIGLEAVRKALRPVFGPPTMWINPICRHWLAEEAGYIQKRGKPIKERDHAMDETRYFAMWQMKPPARKGKVVAGSRSADRAAREASSRTIAATGSQHSPLSHPIPEAGAARGVNEGPPGGGPATELPTPRIAEAIAGLAGQRPPILTPDGISPDLSSGSHPAAPPTSPSSIGAPSESSIKKDSKAADPTGEPGEGPARPEQQPQVNEAWPPRAQPAPQPGNGGTASEPLRLPPGGTGAGPAQPEAQGAPPGTPGGSPAVGPENAKFGLEQPIGGSNGKRKGRVFIPK